MSVAPIPIETESALVRGIDLRGAHAVCEVRFTEEVSRRRLREVRVERLAVGGSWPRSLDTVATHLVHMESEHEKSGVLELGDALCMIRLFERAADIHVAALDRQAADDALEVLREHLPRPEALEVKTPVTLWSDAEHGPISRHRRLDAVCWADVADAYAGPTRAVLEPLMSTRAPERGRLILFHGPPGTGKTHGLRALAHEWREWAAVHFIADPECFLGHGTAYALEVLSARDPEREASREWRLVVLEDAGEMLAIDARREVGQALSRLLNITDGLLGQGMNALVLVTTNEPLGKLHPAIHRDGRCLAQVEFPELPPTEANAWLERQGSKVRVTRPIALAELYSVLNGKSRDEGARSGVGFG